MCCLVAIDLDDLLWRIDLQVAVHKQEQPGRGDVGEEFLRLRIKRGDGLRRFEHELDRQALGTRKRGREERHDALTGDGTQLVLKLALQCSSVTVPLIPGLQRHASDRLGRTDDLKRLISLGQLCHDALHLSAKSFLLLHGCIGCGGWQQDQDALVFLRRQFAACAGVQEIDAADDEGGEQQRHRYGAQAAAQAAFVALLQAAEDAVDQRGQAVGPAAGLAFSVRFKQKATHHRRQSKRHDGRHRHRTDDREGELGE